MLASTLSLCTVGPATVLSHKCDLSLLKDDQIVRDNRLPVHCRHLAATSYCDPGRHANVITPCFLTLCVKVPHFSPRQEEEECSSESWSRKGSVKIICLVSFKKMGPGTVPTCPTPTSFGLWRGKPLKK